MIHPSAFIARGAIVVGDVHLGPESSVWYNCVLRGDSARITVGRQSNIQDLTMIHADDGAPCTIGARVGVGHRAILHGCVVEDECLIGMGAILLNGVSVGRGSVIAAGSLVPEGTQIPAGSLVMGAPGRVIREVDDALSQRIQGTWKHYVGEAERHRAGEYAPHDISFSDRRIGESDL